MSLLTWLGDVFLDDARTECPNCLKVYPKRRQSGIRIPADTPDTKDPLVCDICAKEVRYSEWLGDRELDELCNAGALAERWALARAKGTNEQVARMMYYLGSNLPYLGRTE